MKNYDHKKIEKKWQKEWEKKKIYQAKDKSKKKKFYSLIEFPYPSGDGLHVGHIRSNTAMDIISRKRRMEGYNVLYPIGWDAFGLPTENYAIKTGKQPEFITKKNTNIFRKQLKEIGFSFDWSREVNTTDPKYYKWTQWIFLQFLKKGLAYKAKMAINWCLSCKIGLANEEVVNGQCERCEGNIEKREKEQWMLAITKYADRLHKDLDDVDYLSQIKLSQRNWIGKSEGLEESWDVDEMDLQLKTFTTWPHTTWGTTFLAIAPEHPIINDLVKGTEKEKEIKDFAKQLVLEKAKDTYIAEKEKKGIFTGRYVIHYLLNKKIPIYVANFAIYEYGTGIVKCTPAHDQRDFEFAKKYNLPIIEVIEPLVKNTKGPDGIRSNSSFVKRNAVICVIKHWSKDKYLCLKWKKIDWNGFVVGGVEDGEDKIKAGIREIREETGYKNLKFIRKLGGVIHAQFYHVIKKQNRWAHFQGLYFELQNGDKEEISEQEKSIHDAIWLDKKDLDDFLHVEDMRIVWSRLIDIPKAYTGEGIMINADNLSGMSTEKARKVAMKYSIKIGHGKKTIQYKLRDWVFSRQRYWGEPIPVVHCEKCGMVPLTEKDLPLKLPKVKNYQPTDSGESPLAKIDKWVNTKCPKCKGKAKRETDTMPNWAGSSWYYLRYVDSKNNKVFADSKKLKYWTPVDWYNGGNEHTTLHLLYSRFWHKFLYDLKLVPTTEPYMKRTSHGMVLGEGGIKMSKSLGNVINPDSIVKTYGADTLRLYEMFMGPFDQSVAWSEKSIIGPRRFLERVWKISHRKFINTSDIKLKKVLHKTIKKVSEDIENMRFNTAISAMMILASEIEKALHVSVKDFQMFLQILAPFAPHITEELWFAFGEKKSIHLSAWPSFDSKIIIDEEIKIVVQVNGKVRAEMMINKEDSETKIKNKAIKNQSISKYLSNKKFKKLIYVKNKLINIVI